MLPALIPAESKKSKSKKRDAEKKGRKKGGPAVKRSVGWNKSKLARYSPVTRRKINDRAEGIGARDLDGDRVRYRIRGLKHAEGGPGV